MLGIKQLGTILPRENVKVKLYTIHNFLKKVKPSLLKSGKE